MITSAKLRIYYERDLLGSNSKASDSNQDALKKIIATGNVKIVSEQYTATSDRAEYDVVDKTIILSGEESTVISGKNSLSGTKIMMDQQSGEVKVEDRDERVHISLSDPDESELEVGDLVKVTVLIERSDDALYLPPAAIRTFEGRKFVKVKAGDRLQKVDVKLGVEGEDRIEILEGLEEGQIIEGL